MLLALLQRVNAGLTASCSGAMDDLGLLRCLGIAVSPIHSLGTRPRYASLAATV
jgi:hypothetical protein